MDLIARLRQHIPQAARVACTLPDERTVRELLSDNPQRLRHIFGVVRAAADLGPFLGQPERFAADLHLAALCHDLAYAPGLRVTGFHPLDAAIYLAARNASADVISAVLFHTGAAGEAWSHTAAAPLYEDLGVEEPTLLRDALTFCDLRTLPSGDYCTTPERLLEIVERYGREHPVAVNVLSYGDEFRRIGTRVLRQLARSAHCTLPWVFMDIDSTLVRPGGTLSDENRRAVADYLDAGGRISLATGKHPVALEGLAKQIGTAGPHIAGNGAIIVNPEGRQLVSEITTQAPAVQCQLQGFGVPHACYTEDGIFVDRALVSAEHVAKLVSINEPIPVAGVGTPARPVFKILAFVDRKETGREMQLRELADSSGLSCIRTSSEFLEFISSSGGKGVAVEAILRRFGWPVFHSAGLGDSENDLPMLRRCGMAAAVANASDIVLASVDLTVGACEDNGVAEFLQMLHSLNVEVA